MIQPPSAANAWSECQFLTCSVLPVRIACNLHCPFCFSRSSVSSLRAEQVDWNAIDVEAYYQFCIGNGASRLVITGGGEPLLRPYDVVSLVERGKPYFDEIALFTNGTYLTRSLSQKLQSAGLSYYCFSRHHHNDERCRQLMGDGAPGIKDFVEAAGSVPIRATCVMVKGWIDTPALVDQYIAAFSARGIRQFTFKHTYVAYQDSLFASSPANAWSLQHQAGADPFVGRGEVLASLPWGPQIRRLGSNQVCYYFEPDPRWELENRTCRSANLFPDGTIYASLEDQQSRLYPHSN